MRKLNETEVQKKMVVISSETSNNSSMDEIPRETRNMFHSFSEPKDIITNGLIPEIMIDDSGRKKKISVKGNNRLVIKSR